MSGKEPVDIDGKIISVGDDVLYAMFTGSSLVKTKVTKITMYSPYSFKVQMGKYSTRWPSATIFNLTKQFES